MHWCDTDDQCGDIFTKALPPQKWGYALDLLGMEHDCPVNQPVRRAAKAEIETDVDDVIAAAAARPVTFSSPTCGAYVAAVIVDSVVSDNSALLPLEVERNAIVKHCAATICRTRKKPEKDERQN